jgi:hypothetical protein
MEIEMTNDQCPMTNDRRSMLLGKNGQVADAAQQ